MKIISRNIAGKGFKKLKTLWNSIKANKVKIKIIRVKKNSDIIKEKIIRKAYIIPDKLLVKNSFIYTKNLVVVNICFLNY